MPRVQILDIHVPREGASFPAVLEQVIVPPLPEVQLVGPVARVRAPLVAVPALAVPPTGLRDPTDAALELEEEEDEEVQEEEELEIFDESIDGFEHSSFRPGSTLVNSTLATSTVGQFDFGQTTKTLSNYPTLANSTLAKPCVWCM